MATIIEREIHHTHSGDAGDSSAAMIVTIVALAVIVGFALFVFRLFPFNGVATAPDDGTRVNIDAELPAPTPTPDASSM